MKKYCVLHLFQGCHTYFYRPCESNQSEAVKLRHRNGPALPLTWTSVQNDWITMTKMAHYYGTKLRAWHAIMNYIEKLTYYRYSRLLAVLHSMPLHFGLSNMGPNPNQKRCGWDGESWCLTLQQTAPVSKLLKHKDTDFLSQHEHAGPCLTRKLPMTSTAGQYPNISPDSAQLKLCQFPKFPHEMPSNC